MMLPKVGLSGGLGNQLFQIARGLGASEGNGVQLDCDTSGSYVNYNSEIDSLHFPKEIEIIRFRTHPTLKFLFNRCISTSYTRNPLRALYNRIFRELFSWFFSVLNGLKVEVPDPSHSAITRITKSKMQYFIGYFQTWRWASESQNLELLRKIEPLSFGKELKEKMKEIELQKAIAVHIRLGDYLNEKDFGILTEEYYLRALDLADPNWEKRNIWIFSNDIELARKILPTVFRKSNNIHLVEQVDNSAAATWYLMRFAKDFVIGNSTFSWWAAFLRMNQEGRVCAPNPWFRNLDNPEDLIPPAWFHVDSDFAEDPTSLK